MSKILAIDDDSTTLQLLDFFLTKHKYEVTIASNGVDGIKKAQEIMPDLILLDVMMPHMDGIEVCKKLRADGKTAKIPILFLSALSQDVEVMRGLMAGSDGYIVKPFEPDNLLKSIEKLMENKTGG
ncbi:MAG: response regulator [Elusimicrobiota bacterium]|nr:response regulator [Elusimicrobiota bacterium]